MSNFMKEMDLQKFTSVSFPDMRRSAKTLYEADAKKLGEILAAQAEPANCERHLTNLLGGKLFDTLRAQLILPPTSTLLAKGGHCFCGILPACPKALTREYIAQHGDNGTEDDLLNYLVTRYSQMINNPMTRKR